MSRLFDHFYFFDGRLTLERHVCSNDLCCRIELKGMRFKNVNDEIVWNFATFANVFKTFSKRLRVFVVVLQNFEYTLAKIIDYSAKFLLFQFRGKSRFSRCFPKKVFKHQLLELIILLSPLIIVIGWELAERANRNLVSSFDNRWRHLLLGQCPMFFF